MSDETRYTLDEARREMNRRECMRWGHDWSIIQTGVGPPLMIRCDRCGTAHRIERPEAADRYRLAWANARARADVWRRLAKGLEGDL